MSHGTEEWWVLVEKEGADTTDAAAAGPRGRGPGVGVGVGVGVRGVAEPWV